jgi:hypothetical protein
VKTENMRRRRREYANMIIFRAKYEISYPSLP